MFISDHALLVAKYKSEFKESTKQIPSMRFSSRVLEQVLNDKNIDYNLFKRAKFRIGKIEKRKIKFHNRKRFCSSKNKQNQQKLLLGFFKKKSYLKQFKDMTQAMAKERFSDPKNMFTKLKRITRYNLFQKRDGEVVQQIKTEEGIIEGKEMENQIIKHYHQLHNRHEQNELQQFPTLSVSKNQIMNMMKGVAQGKAGTFDGVNSQLMKLHRNCWDETQMCNQCNTKIEICSMFVQKKFWNKKNITDHCSGRLICLNKVYPSIPNTSQYRPILVTSPVIKLLQGFIRPNLKQYCKNHLNKQQFGFIKNVSIQQCRHKVIEQLNRRKSNNEQTWAIFIDLTSAYDLVDQKILQQLLRDKQILSQDQIQLLRWLNSNTSVNLGSHSTKCSNGVAQGSTLAPLLFDIYADAIIQEIKGKCKFLKLFADDIFSICSNERQTGEFIQHLEETLRNKGMILNKGKSCIIKMFHTTTLRDQMINGIRVQGKYKYLGATITSSLSIKEHLSAINRKINYIQHRLTPIRILKDTKLNINMFKIFCLPLFRMGILNSLIEQKQKKLYCQNAKTLFKKFCFLPFNTSNDIVEKMIGNFYQKNMFIARTIEIRSQIHQTRDQDQRHTLFEEIKKLRNENQMKEQTKWKYYPKEFIQLLWQKHSKICSKCEKPWTSEHLKREFNYNMPILKYVTRYQQDKYDRRKKIDKQIRKDIQFLQKISKRWPKIQNKNNKKN